MLIHASCVAIEGKAVLLAGASGVGKSDLALRLIDRNAQLVSDDQTMLRCENDTLIASAPESIAGLLEIRHVGLVEMPYLAAAPVVLYVELLRSDETLERLPELDIVFLLDHPVQRLRLHSLASSSPAKIRAALTYVLKT